MYLPRGLELSLRRRLETAPVVILDGARAVGKTRLVQHAVEQGWLTGSRSFADDSELSAARAAPRDYVFKLPHGTAIDEVQLCEAVLLPIKERVETAPPGTLLLTGSTRLRRDSLGGSDPLAGRVGSSLRLGPLTLGERHGEPAQLVEQLFDASPPSIERGSPLARSELIHLVQEVGLPALSELMGSDRSDRATSYLKQVTSQSNFANIDVQRVHQLARYLAGRTSTLVNISQFAQDTELRRPTVEKYLARLEEAFVVHRLRGWRRSKDKSETAKAKIHFFDTGIACAVGRLKPERQDQDLGRLAESLVVTELVRQCHWLDPVPDYYHWRNKQREEVDLIIEHEDGRVVCVEVKSAEQIRPADFAGIDAFRRQHAAAFHRGFVFYTGREVLPFGEDRWAIPLSALRRNQGLADPIIGAIAAARKRESNRLRAERDAAISEHDRWTRRRDAALTEVERQLRAIGASLEGYTSDVHFLTDFPERCSLRLRSEDGVNRLALVTIRWVTNPEGFEATISPPRGSEIVNLILVGNRPMRDALTDLLGEIAEALGAAVAQIDQEFGR